MTGSGSPGFLDTPSRPTKPRSRGVTHVIDSGVPLRNLWWLLTSYGCFVDVWKFGFGTAYLDPRIATKVDAVKTHQVKACPGGTLLEAAWAQGRSERFFDWALRTGFDCVEVSRGASGMSPDSKQALIRSAHRHGFEVFSEIGSKDPDEPAIAGAWVSEARADVAAGAAWLVAEGRDSGTVGLYERDGAIRAELVDALGALGGSVAVIFEAPLRKQQAWLINQLGCNVNLGNIAPTDVLALEALRQGLRSDTMQRVAAVGGCASEHNAVVGTPTEGRDDRGNRQ